MAGTEYVVAFGGGVLSFLSPCVLPLIPVYLSMTTGLGVAELENGERRHVRTVLRGAGLFVTGFSLVFVALGMSVTALGSVLLRNQVPITRGAGVVVIAMGLFMLVGTWGGRGSRELRFHPRPARWGVWAAPIAGAAFGFGWTPCIGPVLGSVLTVAAQQTAVARGGLLLLAYSAGLGVPFLVSGVAFHRAMVALRWTRKHSLALVRGSATLLSGYGLLLAFDQLSWVTVQLQHTAASVGLQFLVRLG